VEDKTIKVHYQGACGSCPSSTTGTLQYIEQFLKEAIHPDVEVQAN
jgi:Fe-S cluster biogenesis protein NfuA